MKKRSVFRGLQGKLLTFFLLMALVPLAIMGTWAYDRAKSSLQEEALDMHSATKHKG